MSKRKRKPLAKRWAIVQHYHDGSGILRVWGPFESEQDAREWSLPEQLTSEAMTVVELLEPVSWREYPAQSGVGEDR